MLYRTRTYIAADWTGDKNLIDVLHQWNDSDHWSLSFTDAHELTQARDSSLPCSIKRSLAERLNGSKTFILIVGDNTASLTKGGCQYCSNYSSYFSKCNHSMQVDYRSFIQFECEKAVRDSLKIVVLYNYCTVQKLKCPESIRHIGTHIPAIISGNDGKYYWNYSAIKYAIEN